MTERLPELGHVSALEVDGLTLRVAKTGVSSGVPILLTSPWPESIYAFRDVLPSISDVGPIIAVDLPGFGCAHSRPEVMSPSAMGEFIVKIARTLNIARMHAVGPDVGTSTLLFAAARHPDLFESLVVGSGAISPELTGGALKELIEGPPGALDNIEGGAIAVDFVTQSAAILPPEAVLDDYRISSAGNRFAAAAAFVRAYPRDLPALGKLLPTIKTPVMIISGNRDPVVPVANGELLEKLLAHCRHERLETGHLVWEDAARAYAQLLSTWLQGGYASALSSGLHAVRPSKRTRVRRSSVGARQRKQRL